MNGLPRHVKVPMGAAKVRAWAHASRWCRNGDHPLDGLACADPTAEGRVVRRFRRPDVDGNEKCTCGARWSDHGWIDQNDGITVCPGAYVVSLGFDRYSVIGQDEVAARYIDVSEER